MPRGRMAVLCWARPTEKVCFLDRRSVVLFTGYPLWSDSGRQHRRFRQNPLQMAGYRVSLPMPVPSLAGDVRRPSWSRPVPSAFYFLIFSRGHRKEKNPAVVHCS